MYAQIDQLLRTATQTGEVPGIVAMATDADDITYEAAYGLRRLGNDSPMALDSVILLASMSKPLTTAAVMQLVEQGRVDLDETVESWLPELADPQVLEGFDDSGSAVTRPARNSITLRHLLTHTAGFGYEFFNTDLQRYKEVTGIPGFTSSMIASISTPLLFDPGERWNYGVGLDWAGILLQRVSGQSLGAYLDENLLGPLGMHDTAIVIRPDMRDRLSAVHARGADGSLTALDFELTQAPETEMGGQTLYGTVPDYIRFLRMIINRGAIGSHQVLQPDTVTDMSRNQIGELPVTPLVSVDRATTNNLPLAPAVPYQWGLGFMINQKPLGIGRSAG